MIDDRNVIDDRNANELVAEGKVLLRTPEGSMTRGDRLRLRDDYGDAFRRVLIEHDTAPRQ